jgi:hypothetical protein
MLRRGASADRLCGRARRAYAERLAVLYCRRIMRTPGPQSTWQGWHRQSIERAFWDYLSTRLDAPTRRSRSGIRSGFSYTFSSQFFRRQGEEDLQQREDCEPMMRTSRCSRRLTAARERRRYMEKLVDMQLPSRVGGGPVALPESPPHSKSVSPEGGPAA